jgi:hypothetical protein
VQIRGCPANEGARQTRVAKAGPHKPRAPGENRANTRQQSNLFIFSKNNEKMMANIEPSRGCADLGRSRLALARSSANRWQAGAGRRQHILAAISEVSHLPPMATAQIACSTSRRLTAALTAAAA